MLLEQVISQFLTLILSFIAIGIPTPDVEISVEVNCST